MTESLIATGFLHLAGVTDDGHLLHTIRNTIGCWTPFGDVEGQAEQRFSSLQRDIRKL